MAINNIIPKDFGDAGNKLDGLSNLTNSYVVAPIAGFGIGGFKFSAFKEYRGELKANITDNYNEKNIALHDNIALEPELFTLSGLVGEVSYLYKENKPSSLRTLAEKLTTVAAYLPTLSSTMKNLQSNINSTFNSKIDYVDAAFSSGIDLFQTYQKLNPPKTAQAKAYNYFSALRNARVPISFDTPYGFKGNFAILNVLMVQTETTETTSEVSIILKELRFATTETAPFDNSKSSSRLKNQTDSVKNNGLTKGKEVESKIITR